jgi:Rps23 Pro-64 3,4-dihydroxylase Tpa1-like proline 4-hydroxylase
MFQQLTNSWCFTIIVSFVDTLLCHDDDLEERRIAFIYYLTPDGDDGWTAEDGGQLDLFDCSGKFNLRIPYF